MYICVFGGIELELYVFHDLDTLVLGQEENRQ